MSQHVTASRLFTTSKFSLIIFCVLRQFQPARGKIWGDNGGGTDEAGDSEVSWHGRWLTLPCQGSARPFDLKSAVRYRSLAKRSSTFKRTAVSLSIIVVMTAAVILNMQKTLSKKHKRDE